jgi:Druantia protein DruA
MDEGIRYRGRIFSGDEIEEIRQVIACHGGRSRWFISREICGRWNWRQPNGALKDMVCRGLLLELARRGLIELPACKRQTPYLLAHRKKPQPVEVDRAAIDMTLCEVKPMELLQVRGTPLEKLYKGLIQQYHYLGYTRPVGEHLEYLAMWKGRPVAGFGWCSAPRHIGCRDRYLGWSRSDRAGSLHKVVTNTRFLILPWVKVRHLASHLLGWMARRISGDWQRVYRHEVVWLETFVDVERGFRGTSYRAANWIYLGQTTGRGKDDRTHRGVNRSLKAVFGYPVREDFREALRDQRL